MEQPECLAKTLALGRRTIQITFPNHPFRDRTPRIDWFRTLTRITLRGSELRLLLNRGQTILS